MTLEAALGHMRTHAKCLLDQGWYVVQKKQSFSTLRLQLSQKTSPSKKLRFFRGVQSWNRFCNSALSDMGQSNKGDAQISLAFTISKTNIETCCLACKSASGIDVSNTFRLSSTIANTKPKRPNISDISCLPMVPGAMFPLL